VSIANGDGIDADSSVYAAIGVPHLFPASTSASLKAHGHVYIDDGGSHDFKAGQYAHIHVFALDLTRDAADGAPKSAVFASMLKNVVIFSRSSTAAYQGRDTLPTPCLSSSIATDMCDSAVKVQKLMQNSDSKNSVAISEMEMVKPEFTTGRRVSTLRLLDSSLSSNSITHFVAISPATSSSTPMTAQLCSQLLATVANMDIPNITGNNSKIMDSQWTVAVSPLSQAHQRGEAVHVVEAKVNVSLDSDVCGAYVAVH
jgi:hypothetical protein